MNPFDFFDKIFYINLDSRPERKIAVEQLFSKYGIKAERFPAIQLTPEQNEHLRQDGCYFRGDERPEHARYTKSCTLSHLSVIFRAKLMGYKNVLVFEDDVIFREDIIEELSLALEDLKKQTKSCYVEKLSTYTFKIILTQGLNRQIRRMCNYLNYEVQTLKRVRIMNIKLDMPVGKYRELTPEEFIELNTLLKNSTKTYKAHKQHKKPH